MSVGSVAEFERHRDYLTAVAYRMLGSRSDAEDAVQEAWLRWDAADRDEVRDARAWLTTVTGRICLDQLRSARVRREAYVGPWLPEPVAQRLPTAADDPAERVVRGDEVSYALLVVLERLRPEQRAALVLHDVFEVPFDQIAEALGVTAAAARQHASRARRLLAVDSGPRHTADLAQQRRVLHAFQAAVQSGDLNQLLAVLAPDAVAVGDGGGTVPAGRRPVHGAAPVARLLLGLVERYLRQATWQRVEPALVNGDLGLLLAAGLPDGATLRVAMAFAIADGRITGVFNQVNPAKLNWVPDLRPD